MHLSLPLDEVAMVMDERDTPPGGRLEPPAQGMETKLWQLAEILAAARRIHSSLTLDRILTTFLDIAVGEVGGGGGGIYLRSSEDQGLKLEHHQTQSGLDTASRQRLDGLAAAVARQDEGDALTEDEGGKTLSLPLRDETKASIGVLQIYCDDRTELDAGARLFLRELAHFASLSIRNAQYHHDSLTKAHLDQEIAVARQIQQGTLPGTMPDVPGYDVAGLSRAAEATGGDSFDLVPTGESDLMILLTDATGHGIGPALSVTQVRAMVRLACRLRADLDEVLRHINDQLCEDLQNNRFVTAFIGLLEPDHHRVRYHSAGQGPLMHYRASRGEFAWHIASCPPLGFFPMPTARAQQFIDLEAGDTLGLLTDGVYEAENEAGEMFGKDRVAETIKQTINQTCAATAQEILRRVEEYCGAVPQADDITIVLIRRKT
jgi:phosphoserine phosphatase